VIHRALAVRREGLDLAIDSIVQSGSPWVLHGVPTIFALLVYGVGLGYLARFSRGLS
jgi:hypothetical protein